jgi:hypothetical protein
MGQNTKETLVRSQITTMLAFVVLLLTVSIPATGALVAENPQQPITRRDAFAIATSAATLVSVAGMNANAAETVDMDALKAARSKAPTSIGDMIGMNDPKNQVDMDKINAARSKAGSQLKASKTIVPISDPAPILAIRGGLKGKSAVKIPRVGYSFYKTPIDQAARCTSLAFRTGIIHLDVGTLYNSNEEVAKSLKKYLDIGMSGLKLEKEEKPELLEVLDATRLLGSDKAVYTVSAGSRTNLSPAPEGSAGRRGRREQLFISHKISNAEQSTDPVAVRRAVKSSISRLGCTYLDMVSIHSPLTDSPRRLETYKTLVRVICSVHLGKTVDSINSHIPYFVSSVEPKRFRVCQDCWGVQLWSWSTKRNSSS